MSEESMAGLKSLVVAKEWDADKISELLDNIHVTGIYVPFLKPEVVNNIFEIIIRRAVENKSVDLLNRHIVDIANIYSWDVVMANVNAWFFTHYLYKDADDILDSLSDDVFINAALRHASMNNADIIRGILAVSGIDVKYIISDLLVTIAFRTNSKDVIKFCLNKEFEIDWAAVGEAVEKDKLEPYKDEIIDILQDRLDRFKDIFKEEVAITEDN